MKQKLKPGRLRRFPHVDSIWSKRYARARSQAQYRGEEWQFVDTEWLELWLASGAEPGRSEGCACMIRRDTRLPWRKSNCVIVSRNKNHPTLEFQYAKRSEYVHEYADLPYAG